MTDPVAGLAEMARVTRADGVVAACVWDLAGGRAPISAFWQAARELDRGAEDESGLAGARAGHLSELFETAGLRRVEETALSASVEEVLAPDGSPSRIMVKDTWNTHILDQLEPWTGDVVVSKHRYSGFFETELDDVLRGLNTKYLIVTGCTTSICVESTVRDAMFRDYTCLVLEDCTAEPLGSDLPRTNHEASLLNIETLFGWVSNSAALIDALKPSAKLVSTA